MIIYFFDTYAIIEIIVGNKNYEKYRDDKIITSVLNVIELHYALLKKYNKKFADNILLEYSKFIVPITLKDIAEANNFRLDNIKKRLSTADAMGYVLAAKYNTKFLTGDKEFAGLNNVEFAK